MTKAATRKLPQLGNTVVDVTSGLKGIAYQYLELISGTVQMSIQPALPEGMPAASATEPVPPGLSVDIQLLDKVDDGIASRVVTPAPETIALGNEVEDITTGLKGIAVARTTFINGCVYYRVSVKMTAKQRQESTPMELFTSSKILKVTGKGIAPQVAQHSEAPVERRPGGPSMRAPRV